MIALIVWILNILVIAIIVRALLSWIDPQGRNVVSRVLFTVTEPVLAPIRNLLGGLGGGLGGLDLSPIIAILLIQVIAQALGAGLR